MARKQSTTVARRVATVDGGVASRTRSAASRNAAVPGTISLHANTSRPSPRTVRPTQPKDRQIVTALRKQLAHARKQIAMLQKNIENGKKAIKEMESEEQCAICHKRYNAQNGIIRHNCVACRIHWCTACKFALKGTRCPGCRHQRFDNYDPNMPAIDGSLPLEEQIEQLRHNYEASRNDMRTTIRELSEQVHQILMDLRFSRALHAQEEAELNL